MPYPPQIQPQLLGAMGLEVLESRGWDSWSLRSVSSALGVTPNALYRHVDGKAGLMVEIGAASARELTSSLQKGLSSEESKAASPLTRALLLSAGYVRFALDRPHAYRAFMSAKPAPGHPSLKDWLDLWALVRDEVAGAVPESPDAAALALWALLHGRVEVAAGPAGRATAEQGLLDSARVLLNGFRASPPIASPLSDIPR